MKTNLSKPGLRATIAGMAMALLPCAVMAVDPGRGVGAPGPGVAPGVGAPGAGAVDPGRNQPGAAGNVGGAPGVGAPGVGAPGAGAVDPGLNQPGAAGNVGGVARRSVRR
jgi:hypothetical protein